METVLAFTMVPLRMWLIATFFRYLLFENPGVWSLTENCFLLGTCNCPSNGCLSFNPYSFLVLPLIVLPAAHLYSQAKFVWLLFFLLG